jgi:hypothetical protein
MYWDSFGATAAESVLRQAARQGQEICLFFIAFRPALAPTLRIPAAISREVKREGGRAADYSPPSKADFKKRGANPHSPIRLHGLVFN